MVANARRRHLYQLCIFWNNSLRLEKIKLILIAKRTVRRLEKPNLGQIFRFAVINSDITPDDGLDVLRSCPHKHRSAKMTFF